jgi:hypothetical protein
MPSSSQIVRWIWRQPCVASILNDLTEYECLQVWRVKQSPHGSLERPTGTRHNNVMLIQCLSRRPAVLGGCLHCGNLLLVRVIIPATISGAACKLCMIMCNFHPSWTAVRSMATLCLKLWCASCQSARIREASNCTHSGDTCRLVGRLHGRYESSMYK